MRTAVFAALAGIALSSPGHTQPTLQLKNRVIDTSEGMPAGAAALAAKRAVRAAEGAGRIHLLLQFTHMPGEADADLLRGRGGAVLGYVHENGWMVSIDAGVSLDGLDLQWAGMLEPEDKISADLAESADPVPVLVEFHDDVDPAGARELALGLGMELRDNPDISPRQLLVMASSDQVRRLAAKDPVAYLFPASDDLIAGRPTIACASARTLAGAAGQYVAKIGDGWDGPGLGSASLTYSWGAATQRLPAGASHAEILRAFNEWSRVARITFSDGGRSDAARNLNILFGTRDHGDPYPFDGPGGVLAHTFYPSPPNPEPLAGDMHFDDDERWQIGADIDLFSVALHEAGHALGLGHSDLPGAVMYPYYQKATALTGEDIGAIQTLYAAPTTVPSTPVSPSPAPAAPLTISVNATSASTSNTSVPLSGTVSGGSGDITVRWQSDRGGYGSAAGRAWSFTVPLSIGVNIITVTASDTQMNQVSGTISVTRQVAASPAAVMISILYPGPASSYSTASPTLSLKGTASHPTGIRRVEWSNTRGGSGIASGTNSWESGNISLSDGLNTLTVKATATDNSSAIATVQITYSRSTTKDTTAPTLTVTSPAMPSYVTQEPSIVLQGTASDNLGVTSVTWFSTTGAGGNAIGTTSWKTPAVPLCVGFNTIVIRAYDAAGNVGWRVVQVTRQ